MIILDMLLEKNSNMHVNLLLGRADNTIIKCMACGHGRGTCHGVHELMKTCLVMLDGVHGICIAWYM